MKAPAYVKYVVWSEDDQAYIGRCPDVFFGGTHGADEIEVYRELCRLVEEELGSLQASGKPLPAVRTQLVTPAAA